MRKQFILFVILCSLIEVYFYFKYPVLLWSLFIIAPIIFLGIYDMIQKKHDITRNFPFLGWGRYVMEILRPKIYQYFVESDIDGRPIGRIFRSLVYQRAKGDVDTTPFGTQLDVNAAGYEWINHSINAVSYTHLRAHET